MKALTSFSSVALLWIVICAAESVAQPPPLGLLRLKSNTRPIDPTPLAADKFSIDELAASSTVSASKSMRNNVDYLMLGGGKEWSRPLRGNGKDVTFVAFQAYASEGTIIDIAGARFGIVTSPVSGCLQLMYDDSTTGTLQWKALGVHIPTAKYSGSDLAPLPTLTVCIDSNLGVWHIYNDSRLLADHLPLIAANRNNRTFDLRAGGEGAWVIGLVLADENPVYEDANANGIDDRFEIAQRGSLLPVTASAAERHLLAQQWSAAQHTKSPPAFFVQRPSPDTITPPLKP